MMTNSYLAHTTANRQALNERYQAIAWAFFLIMTGVLWLLPDIDMNGTLWILGTGFILLGLNVVRAMSDIETSGFTVICGLFALSIGLSNLLGAGLPLLPGLLILAGVLLMLKSRVRR